MAADPGGGLPPRFHGAAGRRTLTLFGIGALVLVVGFIVVTGAELIYLVRNGQTSVSSALPADLPREVPLCTAFKPSRSFTTTADGGKHFLVQGDCPENSNQLDDDLTRLLQYNGWTVHDDGQGNLSCYSYERHERLDVGMSNSNTPANTTSVTLEVWTALAHPPDGFRRAAGSPAAASASATVSRPS